MASKKQDDKDGAQSGSAGADEKCGQQAGDEKCVEPRPDSEAEGDVSREKQKEGEPRDNLRRRAEWFQKRH